MEILHQFGFDVKLFIGQIVNFLILAYIFKRFLYKPILDVFREREEKINTGLGNAEKAKAALEKARHDSDSIIKNTRAESHVILENTKKLAEEMKQEFAAKSRAESEKILADAKAQALDEMRKVEKEVKNMSLDISKKLMNEVIGKLFSEEEKQKILKRALENMQKEADKL
jgi:F-type H+-transporting ATPase subunit b